MISRMRRLEMEYLFEIIEIAISWAVLCVLSPLTSAQYGKHFLNSVIRAVDVRLRFIWRKWSIFFCSDEILY